MWKTLFREIGKRSVFRIRTERAPDVIYLGYDDHDNVASLRSVLLDRLQRGDLDAL